jgi:hypothetical protein
MRTWSSGKFALKSDLRTEASNTLKKDPCAPTPTSRVVFAFAHACASLAVDVATLKSAEASRFTNTLVEATPPSADSPTSSCGMRWPVAVNVAPTSGLPEKVTSPDEQQGCQSVGSQSEGNDGNEQEGRKTHGSRPE